MADTLNYSSDGIRKTTRRKEEMISESQIEMIDIELSPKDFPRIFNIITWLEKKGIISELKRYNKCDSLVYHIILLHAGYPKTVTILQLFGGSRVTKHFPHSVNGIERIKSTLDEIAANDMPVVLMFLFNPTMKGNLCDQDTDWMESILKRDVEQIDILFVTNDDCYSQTEDFLTDVSSIIKKQDINSTHGKLFLRRIITNLADQLKKRTGLYLEKQTKTILRESIQKLNLERKLKISEEVYSELIGELRDTKPDSCDIHELEVCLERLSDVCAFGYEEEKITVYLNESKGREKVITTLKKSIPEIIDYVSIQIWDKTVNIQKCSKQGSKISRCDDHYGTLGLFLKDNQANVYFTTCAHVIPHGVTVYDEDKHVLGKCVMTKDTAAESLDLSIVKVDEKALSRCQFGLRNTHDQLIDGVITDESVIKSEATTGLPVYKWGATTGLTKGTYKGWIAKKNSEDRFDEHLHRIEGVASQIFKDGDSGSLVCFEATGSPQLQSDSAAYIFVGKLTSSEECSKVDLEHLYYCYHISNILNCKIENNKPIKIEACLNPEGNM